MNTATDPGRSTLADYADPLRHELADAKAQAGVAYDDHDAALAAADRLAVLIRTLDDLRREASVVAKDLIGQSIRTGTDPRDFYGRPFSGTIVRDITKLYTPDLYAALFPHPGRRPRTQPTTEE